MGTHKKLFGFIALLIAMFMGVLDSTIINIALPDMTAYFNVSLNDSSWISTIYVLGLSVCMITGAKLADQFGRKKVMLIGLTIFGISSALCGLSSSLLFLIAVRLVQSVGGAIIMPVVVPMAIELFGKEAMGKLAGVIGAVTALAAAGGPPIGGLLISHFSWQAIFFVNVPFALIAIILTALFTKESYDMTISKKIDWLGMTLLSTAMFLLTFALLKGNDYGWSSLLIIGMFIGFVVTLVLFLLVETKAETPMVELKLFRERTFTASTICYLITGFAIACPIIILNYFLQDVLGYEVLHAASIVVWSALTVVVAMPLGSFIANRFGARLVNFTGILCMAAGTFLLSLIRVDTPSASMILYMIVFGFGMGFTIQSIVSAIQYLPDEKSGIGSGIVNAARQVGTCIGIALLVSILTVNMTQAKTDIQANVFSTVQGSNVPQSVKMAILRDVDAMLADTAGNMDQEALENKLISDIQTAIQADNAPKVSFNDQLKLLGNLQQTIKQLTQFKNEKIENAFQRTYLLSAVILLLFSVFGLFTDRRKVRS